MDLEIILEHPIFRMLFFVGLAGIFFYRDWPKRGKSKWYQYLVLPVYWLYVLGFGYYGLSGMVSAGVSELFSKYAENGAISPALVEQLTITSLGLLFLYRLSSRYEVRDEKTNWTADFIKGVVVSYIAISALFYAFADYLVESPKLESFSGTPWAYALLGIFFTIDFLLWFAARKTEKS